MDAHVLNSILSLTNSYEDYKSFCLVSRAWYDELNKIFPVTKPCNHLLTLLQLFPNGSSSGGNWDYNNLSNNCLMTIEYIEANIDKPWNYKELSWRIATCEFVDKHPDKPWDYYALSANKNITWDYIMKNINKPWDMSVLSERDDIDFGSNFINYKHDVFCDHQHITWEIVQKYPNIRWDYKLLSMSKNITWEIICNNPDKPWDYDNVAVNPNITWEIIATIPNYLRDFRRYNPNIMLGIEKYEHLLDYFDLSHNREITEEYILANIDKPWNYKMLSYHLKSITWKLLSLDKSWDYGILSSKIKLSLEEFAQIQDKPWNYDALSHHATWDFITRFIIERISPNRLNFSFMTRNPNIPLSVIFNNLDKDRKGWKIKEILDRSDITWKDVAKHINLWTFKKISKCSFNEN